MKILITGALGYVGSFLTEELLVKYPQFQLFGVDDLSNVRNPSIPEGLNYTNLDLADFEKTNSYFQNHHFDVVIHLAARIYVHDSFQDRSVYYLNNFLVTEHLLSICRLRNIDKIIFASSSTLYRSPQDLCQIKEDADLFPLNPYGQTKRDCEKLILSHSHFFRGYIFRFFNIAGAHFSGIRGQDSIQPKHVIDRMSSQISLGLRQVMIYGDSLPTFDGTVVRDYIHVLDVVNLLVCALEKVTSEKQLQIFNCGSGQGTSLKQIVSVFSQLAGQNIKIQWGPRHQGDPVYLVSDNEKVQSYFQWRVVHSEITQLIESSYRWSLKRNKYSN